MLTRSVYDNAIRNLTGFGLNREEAAKAGQTSVFLKFSTMVQNIEQSGPQDTLKSAHDFAKSQLGEAAVAKILDEIEPGLSRKVKDKLAASVGTIGSTGSSREDVERAYRNVKSILNDPAVRRAANESLGQYDLAVTDVAYNDAVRSFGVSGPGIADVRYEVFEASPRMRHVAHTGQPRSTFAAPIVKENNWDGPFAVADLTGLTVQTGRGEFVSLADVIRDPQRYINGWNGPNSSFWSDDMDKSAGATLEGLKGPKVSVQDNLVPVADGHTETVPSIYTYGSPTLVLIAVPGEGISAHYTDGDQKIRLPINKDGQEKALRITREQFSNREGPTSFSNPGENVGDGQLINSAIIVQIPVEDPNRRRTMRGGAAVLGLESTAFSFGPTTRSMRGGAASLDSGRFGTEAGVVSAGADLGAQKDIPDQIRRNQGRPIVVTYSLYAATDSNVVGDGLAARMRKDIDDVRNHPAFKGEGVENP